MHVKYSFYFNFNWWVVLKLCVENQPICVPLERGVQLQFTFTSLLLIVIHSFIHAFINIITLLVVKCQNPSSVRIFLTSLGYLVVLYVFSFLFLLLFRSLVLSFFSSLLSIKILLLIRRPSACSWFLILPVFFFFVFLFIFFFPFWSFSFIVNLVVLKFLSEKGNTLMFKCYSFIS